MPTYQKVWKVNGAIIRQRGYSYQVETHHNGKRTRQTFKTVEDADNYAKQVKAELKSEGDMALAIKGRPRIDTLRLLDALPTSTLNGGGYGVAAALLTVVLVWLARPPLPRE